MVRKGRVDKVMVGGEKERRIVAMSAAWSLILRVAAVLALSAGLSDAFRYPLSSQHAQRSHTHMKRSHSLRMSIR